VWLDVNSHLLRLVSRKSGQGIHYPEVSHSSSLDPADDLAPLFFPSRSFNKKISHRPLLRTTSSASIYAPPVLQHSISAPVPLVRTHSSRSESRDDQAHSATISGRTPGRRGEKRKRPQAEEDEKKRKSGKIVLDKDTSRRSAEEDLEGDEDIFGKRAAKQIRWTGWRERRGDGGRRSSFHG
jgi:hypothetical protein